ncbi:hypothetical protein TI05_09280, partial [Achromatium sp. WMS3]
MEDIDFFVDTMTRKCGISTRGLAKLCGVYESTLRGVLKKADSTEKVEGGVRGNYETELYKILKGREIFLKDVRGNSPILNGKEIKAILHDVCFDVAHYYSGKGYAEAHATVGKMGRFGTEQFIMIQVGFIPLPESIMLDDIEYLIAKETVQVNKSRQEEVQFFTNPITGKCGIELQGLCYICGGVALKHVKTFLEAQQDPYVQANHPQQIVKASICAKVLEHFGHQHKPRKTVAQHWAKTLNPIVPVLHQKTNYQAPAVTDRESMLQAEIANLKQEIEHLQQLAHQTRGSGNMDWHDFLVRFLKQ